MSPPADFYSTESEWAAIAERLKLRPCPHCQAVGTLNRHGSFHGYDDSSPRRKTLRGHRVYCSNRHRRPGCGRTVSYFLADKIRRCSRTTTTLFAFLKLAVVGPLVTAIHKVGGSRQARSWQRIWTRFGQAQCRIRTALLSRGPPPEGSFDGSRWSAIAQVLAHLQTLFPSAECPLAAYQQATGSFVV